MADLYETVREQLGPRFGLTEDGCWKPFAVASSNGYVHIRVKGKLKQMHRYVYEIVHGPEGHDLHHTCGNTWCCNPEHLQPITKSDHQKIHQKNSRYVAVGRNR